MWIKPLLLALAAALLGGCITTDVVVTLNPDGSGNVVYTAHVDRAPDDIREQIRQQLNDDSSTSSQEHSLENMREFYPAPHFTLLSHEEDRQRLTTRIVLQFNDINALLIPRGRAHLGLKALDFSVEDGQLVFSVKEEAVSQRWPEKYDAHPAHERISIINAASGESVVFEREVHSKIAPADWSAPLAFPGHRIKRERNLQLFHDYPVVGLPPCGIEEARWVLRHPRAWSSLTLKLLATLPADGAVYVRWNKPAVLDGRFLPEAPLVFKDQISSLRGEFGGSAAQEVELAFEVPTHQVDALAASRVRLTAYRSRGQRQVEVGLLKPNTEYAFGAFTLTTDDLENNRVGFRLEGSTDRLKGALLKTERGNLFPLKNASSSGFPGEVSRNYWEQIPLDGTTLVLELHKELEPCYLDLPIPPLDLKQRSWRIEQAEKNRDPDDWKAQLSAVHPELFAVSVPPVEAGLFEDKSAYGAYFEALADEQLMPALVQVVDFMVRHNPERGQHWIQEIARTEIAQRTAFLEANRRQVCRQLFSVYAGVPERMICLSTFFTALRMVDVVQPWAVVELDAGNLRFAEDSFFGNALSAAEVAVLKKAFVDHSDWMVRNEILDILHEADAADRGFVAHVATDPTENEHVRLRALGFLMAAGPFPEKTFSLCMADTGFRNSAVRALRHHLDRALKAGPAQRAGLKSQLAPHIPLLEDLAEQLRSHDAAAATQRLEQIRQL